MLFRSNTQDDLDLFILPGYHRPIALNRPNEDGGGGVALYISSEYNFKVREDLTYNSNESQCLFTEADRNNISVLIGVSYKPPSANIESYSQSLSDILDKLDNCSKKCFLAGDFNIDLLKCESHIETNSFFNRLLTYSFFPTIF